MLLLIDNYDSFTYNLVEYFRSLGEDIVVFRNNQISLMEIEQINPELIILSPGPGNPKNAGICIELVQSFYHQIPIFGVCLGHQIIAEAFNGKVIKANRPMHGKTSQVHHQGHHIFSGLPSPIQVGRYHSLLVERNTLPTCFEITAETIDGEIMGIRHKQFPVEGVQFHPESILTEFGLKMIHNSIQNLLVKE